MLMPRFTVQLGLALIVLGGVFFLLTLGSEHNWTALIPSVIGAVLVALGVLARRPGLRMHMMHAAAGLALLGAVGIAGRAAQVWLAMLRGGGGKPLAAVEMTITALALAVYVVVAVRSFLKARSAREAMQQASHEA